MLHAVAKLAQDGIGHVEGILGDEIHPDALGANKTHDLLDLVEKNLRRVGEKKMRFVEEEHQRRFVAVTYLRQSLVELREQPQQQRRVKSRGVEQLVGGKDVDIAAPS